MIEGGSGARFLFEPPRRVAVAGEGPVEELDRDLAAQSRIMREIHLPVHEPEVRLVDGNMATIGASAARALQLAFSTTTLQ